MIRCLLLPDSLSNDYYMFLYDNGKIIIQFLSKAGIRSVVKSGYDDGQDLGKI